MLRHSRLFRPLLARPRIAASFSLKASILTAHDNFIPRHIGPSATDVEHMTKVIDMSVDELISKTVPKSIRLKKPLALDGPRGEVEALEELHAIMSKNKVARTHIGMGFYDVHTPKVILRNILENPLWYTPYTPYQAEISQGRMEMLLNYQTMIIDMTGMSIANASLLCEATAAAEAMNMLNQNGKSYLVADDVHPQNLEVIRTRATALGVEVRVCAVENFDFSNKDVGAVLVQYPATDGRVVDYKAMTEAAHAGGAKVAVASDLLALALLAPPGDWGADVCVGNAGRMGVPMGFGGPHAAFLATKEEHKRKMPGRIMGVSRDSRGKPALRMAMQTREQHIRRDKATSNICTAQALLANMAAAYTIYHGPEGLKHIANKVHAMAAIFAHGVRAAGYTTPNKVFFDTVRVDLSEKDADAVFGAAAAKLINLRRLNPTSLTISFDETTTAAHVNELVDIFAAHANKPTGFNAVTAIESVDIDTPQQFARTSDYLTHPVFHMYRSETEMMRYITHLQSKDGSLCHFMIPLGSCTMKLNAASEMIPVTWPEVGRMHPFAPESQTQGYKEFLDDLAATLATVTGFHAVSLQPNSGAQGEYAGLLAIRNYHLSRGDANRNVCIIPVSAHGTNPASAAMVGMRVVVCKCDEAGEIDITDFKAKIEQHKDNLSAAMITYPSTHGVFEENIRDLCNWIHEAGGMVYMDGANMNAQVGLCSPGDMGADVCHLNLHKTFCIPHGGGGPGMGPIGVVKALAPFLPSHPVTGMSTVGPVSSAPFSSASILPISWMYCRMMGGSGLTKATEMAILNANYMAKRLEKHYQVLFRGKHNTVAHEFILDFRPFKASAGVVEEDVAKRLQDYNFHAPTMSWPVGGTLMVEPTESESLAELDRFCDALIAIRGEIADIEMGLQPKDNNLLKNSPHTQDMLIGDEWNRPYSREKAAYPLPYLKSTKFWPTVGRLDNVFGDRNVVCSCPPLEAYTQ